MSDTTPKLQLPYIAAGQAQKHVTLNEALRTLDALVQCSVVTRGLTAPPISPTEGERHIPAPNATGDWAGQTNAVTAWQDGAWRFHPPQPGWIAWVVDEAQLFAWTGATWEPVITGAAPAVTGNMLGINTAPDTTNRLAVKSDAVLLSHDDATPGTGDIRLTLNKLNASQTSSIVFSSNWGGRAEIGLAGDENIRLKVSPDGAAWHEALVVERETGRVSLPATPPTGGAINLLSDGGRFAGTPEPATLSAGAFSAPTYLNALNGSVVAPGPQFHHDNATFGGTNDALSNEMADLIWRMRSSANDAARRFGPEFHAMHVTAGTNAAYSASFEGETFILPLNNSGAPQPLDLSFNIHVRALSGDLLLQDAPSLSTLYIDGAKQMQSVRLTPATGWVQITRLMLRDPAEFRGYDNSMLRLYAQAGAQFLLAAPILTPGQLTTTPGRIHGLLPTIGAW